MIPWLFCGLLAIALLASMPIGVALVFVRTADLRRRVQTL